ncbi:hypothetical protein H257_13710 [Aphanomyces astaci]|uniref:Uncharacterized protein n=1 Tax=Aphanomyces astaci TaxID=112090 RepID=W4FU36_APHAT|nr:hypothetical protein H257_13710 [Aphanomyces astaci]ETV70977.1 hypothetical protein H257_13710 [Aphanomyces astaci]|eukprot:XP_009839640.1 hypothetical protein H257_13710 [Aphanomyces astaci]
MSPSPSSDGSEYKDIVARRSASARPGKKRSWWEDRDGDLDRYMPVKKARTESATGFGSVDSYIHSPLYSPVSPGDGVRSVCSDEDSEAAGNLLTRSRVDVNKEFNEIFDALTVLANDRCIDLLSGFLDELERLMLRVVSLVEFVGDHRGHQEMYFACLDMAAQAAAHLTRTQGTWMAKEHGFTRY